MILHVGERVYWGAPEVIYLEGVITTLNEETQTVTVHIERATSYSAHLIDSDVPFAANGIKPLTGNSPPGTTNQRSTIRQSLPPMSDDEKVRRTASVAVHEQYGYNLPAEQEKAMIEQVTQALNSDPQIRTNIITAMNEILRREF